MLLPRYSNGLQSTLGLTAIVTRNLTLSDASLIWSPIADCCSEAPHRHLIGCIFLEDGIEAMVFESTLLQLPVLRISAA